MSKFEHFLTMDNLNPAIKSIDFSKNEVVQRAKEIEKELLTNDLSEKKPFENLTYLNIDDFQSVGQKPITYFRQVMTLCTYPSLISSDNFPQDVKDKAKKLLSSCLGGSTGAYPEGAGIDQVREDIAEFISKRDEGVETNPDEVFMSHGASGGIKTMIKMLSNHWSDGEKPAGFMIPVPCYPLFLSAITELNSQAIYYHLNENANWRIDIDELERAYNESLSRCKPRSICIINPGNPTGHVLTVENIREIIRWAYEKRLYILADEVHQDTVYTSQGFHSFRKVAHLLGPPYSKMEMASFYSTSKGFMAECGSLSGYYEVANIDKDVRFELKKLTSAIHTSAVGQILMSAIVDGPKLGDPSYELFIKEKTSILDNLKENAEFVPCFLNEIDGIVCNPVQGAIYAFPRLKLPQKAVEHAKLVNLKADVYYCLELLNRTGICVLPGSTFEPAKKVDDEETLIYHFRVSLSYGNDQMRSILEKIKRFHIGFLKQWDCIFLN